MRQTSKNRPYDLLARFYKQLLPDAAAMNRHARERILGKILPSVRAACDLACGSGETAIDYAHRGIRTYAIDSSPRFCQTVRQAARAAGLRIAVQCADMRTFRLPQPIDLITCEFSAINHLSRKGELLRVLRNVARALQPGGVFLFDVNTRRSFAEQYTAAHWFEGKDFKLVLHSDLDKPGTHATLHCEWFVPQGRFWRHSREHFENVCWSDAEIRAALRKAGFRHVRVWDGMDVRPPHPQAKRGYDTYYLAQKSG